MNLPMLGLLFRLENGALLSGALSRLIGRGVSLPEALRIVTREKGRPFMEEALLASAARVLEGHELSESLLPEPLFPPSLRWRIAIGERSGKLAEALSEAGDHYLRELRYLTDRFIRLAEPVAMLFVGMTIVLLFLLIFANQGLYFTHFLSGIF